MRLLTRSLIAQQTRFGIDPTVGALHHMTVADRDPAPAGVGGSADLDVTVAQAFGGPAAPDNDPSAGLTRWC